MLFPARPEIRVTGRQVPTDRFVIPLQGTTANNEDQKVKEDKIYEQARELIRDGYVSIFADDGREFVFVFREEKIAGFDGYRINVDLPGDETGTGKVGHIIVLKNIINVDVFGDGETCQEEAVRVDKDFRRRYKGIDKALLSFAMAVTRIKYGKDYFDVDAARPNNEQLFKSMGFSKSPVAEGGYRFNLGSERSIPPITIKGATMVLDTRAFSSRISPAECLKTLYYFNFPNGKITK